MGDGLELLDKLADGGLVNVDQHKDAAIALQRHKRVWVTDIGGSLYACLAPRSEKARLQESLARHKLAYQSQAPFPGRDSAAANIEAAIGEAFRAIGLHPSYPLGFL